MAHLWSTAGTGSWTAVIVDAETVALDPSGLVRRPAGPVDPAAAPAAVVCRAGGVGCETWTLLVPAGVAAFVNGVEVRVGIAVLADRDEIRLSGSRSLFFSTETAATVAPFPADGPRGFCPRCRQPIEPGTPAVNCPRCALWHHQSQALPCWTYADRCAACAQPSALDAGFTWTPEEV
jgi:hypothetical protein